MKIITKCSSIILLCFFFINARAQKNIITSVSADCPGAIELRDTIFIAENSPVGFGKVYEYPKDTYNPMDTDYEGEHNSVWFKLTVPVTCMLTMDIIPDSKLDDYDFIIYKYTGNEKNFCNNIKNRKIKPERMIISQNDTSVNSRTGLAYNKTKHNIPPGPGESYGEALPVKKGEIFYLYIDNVRKGKGFTLLLHYIKEVAEKEIKFKTIYFEKDDASILPSSITAVDSAYNILAGNPEINIEIQGHVNWPKQWEQFANTDGLQKLSEERAKAIYLNFVKKGISANRMKYKGFSNTKMNFPYATTESGMQMNRRVEIVVVKK